MAKAITEAQILSSTDRASLKVDAILQKIIFPVTYTYKNKEVTIKNAWKDGQILWLDISVKGMDLWNRNPFGFVNPPLKVGVGVFDTAVDEDGIEYQKERMVFDPFTAIKEVLNQTLEGVK